MAMISQSDIPSLRSGSGCPTVRYLWYFVFDLQPPEGFFISITASERLKIKADRRRKVSA